MKTFAYKMVLAILIIGFSCGCTDGKVGDEEDRRDLRKVRYMEVQTSRPDTRNTFPGIVKAGTSVLMSFKVSGTIDRMAVEVGDRLDRGDLIAKLESTDYELRVQEAAAGLDRRRAEARNAVAGYKRIKSLYENGNASLNELDGARAAADSTRAAVDSMERQLQLARRQLQYTELSAPADCRVAEVASEINENISSGQPIVIINYSTPLHIQVAVPARVISRISRGDTVKASVSAFGRMELEGAVTEIGVSATRLQTTFPVTVRITGETKDLRPGMAADVTFRLSPRDQSPSIYLPPVAVGEDMDARFVYVLEPLGDDRAKVHYRKVTTGGISSQGIEIIQGLQGGEKVVTAGISRITDGMAVSIRQEEGRF